MARTFIVGLILLLGMPLSSFAGQITDIGVGKKTQHEIEIFIKGDFSAYQSTGQRSPARFVIDLEGTGLAENVSRSIDVKGPIVSGIKAITRGNNVRVVVASADSKRLFHCTMQEKEGEIVLRCWMPKETAGGLKAVPDSGTGSTVTPLSGQGDLGVLFDWPAKPEEENVKKGTKKLAKYTGEKITLDFYKTGLHNVFRLFAEISGKNIIIDDRVKGELTLSLKEVPWDEAMDLVLELKDLVKEERPGTIIIKPKPEKASPGKGELLVKKFSEEILQPARLLKMEKENRQRAQDIILKAHNLEAAGKSLEALRMYEKAYGLWKDNPDLILKTAYLYYVQGCFAKCYYFSGQALRLNPKNAEAALYAALSAARMEKTNEARKLFDLATDAQPQIPEAFFNYGMFLKNHKDYEAAARMYQKYEQLFGPSLDVRMEMAGLCEIQGNASEACIRYKEILKSGFRLDRRTSSNVRRKIQILCNEGED